MFESTRFWTSTQNGHLLQVQEENEVGNAIGNISKEEGGLKGGLYGRAIPCGEERST
jgi:hypothetical protein